MTDEDWILTKEIKAKLIRYRAERDYYVVMASNLANNLSNHTKVRRLQIEQENGVKERIQKYDWLIAGLEGEIELIKSNFSLYEAREKESMR